MQTVPELEVYKTGELLVLGFGGREISDYVNLAACRDEIHQLIVKHKSRALAIDMTGVQLVPSGLLGVLVSTQRQGVEVHLFNLSEEVREVLELSKLSSVFHLHDVEL